MNDTPTGTKLGIVEWLDIADTADIPGLCRRWSVGWVVNWGSFDGVECCVIAATWDEDTGWSDYTTIPTACVIGVEYPEERDDAEETEQPE